MVEKSNGHKCKLSIKKLSLLDDIYNETGEVFMNFMISLNDMHSEGYTESQLIELQCAFEIDFYSAVEACFYNKR